MLSLTLEPTNLCNRSCVHCARDKLEPRGWLPLPLLARILEQARALGIRQVCLTGGEPLMYPDLAGLLDTIVEHGFRFNLVSNGFRFKETALPLVLEPRRRGNLSGICLSLDGPSAASHDALRGDGSFKEVLEAASLCRLKQIPLSLKSVITNHNKSELTELALLGARLGAEAHSFLHPFPTPRLIKEGVIPPPEEVNRLLGWVMNSLSPTIRSRILVEGSSEEQVVFTCNTVCSLNVDHQGKLVFCCNLSHVVDDGRPATPGREVLADLTRESLATGIARHFQLLARFVADRLRDAGSLGKLTSNPCYWCYKYFGKLEWLRNYPESPWARGVIDETAGGC